MVLRDALRRPQSLLIILQLLTLVSVSALAWLGWRLVAQEQIVASQRAREHLDQAADRIAANFRRSLDEPGRLNGLTLNITKDSVTPVPPGRLLYYPGEASEPEAPPNIFRAGETHEFRDPQPAVAIAAYQQLAQANDTSVRAGALLRLARVLRKTGRQEQSVGVYRRLAALTGVRVAGAAADLVARHELCTLRGGEDPQRLLADLRDARWQLQRGQFEFYWDDVSRLAGHAEVPDVSRVALAEAARGAHALAERPHDAEQVVHATGVPILLIWRGATVLLATVDAVLQQITAGEEVYCAAVDHDGARLGGQIVGHGRATLRSAAEFRIPFTLEVAARLGAPDPDLLSRQRFLITTITLMIVFLLSGAAFIARAIQREAAVARLQSDFVSAVSHEFRSPLTSMRQLSEILADGRVPNEERRQLYYQTLVGETRRLERLVETLLNFGRMEAGAQTYRFQLLDAGQLAQESAAAYQTELAHARKIVCAGQSDCLIRADAEALGVALRNLLDNAVKYSPPDAPVHIACSRAGTEVEIRVRDAGPGIPAEEQKAIFEKFVRGSAAVSLNIKGTGVGLAMVRQIVAAHGGEIRVESQPGMGSTFTIILPAAESV